MPLSKIDEIKWLSAMCQLNTLSVMSKQDVRHRGIGDCDVWDLVSGPRGAGHLFTSTAILYGDLINA